MKLEWNLCFELKWVIFFKALRVNARLESFKTFFPRWKDKRSCIILMKKKSKYSRNNTKEITFNICIPVHTATQIHTCVNTMWYQFTQQHRYMCEYYVIPVHTATQIHVQILCDTSSHSNTDTCINTLFDTSSCINMAICLNHTATHIHMWRNTLWYHFTQKHRYMYVWILCGYKFTKYHRYLGEYYVTSVFTATQLNVRILCNTLSHSSETTCVYTASQMQGLCVWNFGPKKYIGLVGVLE